MPPARFVFESDLMLKVGEDVDLFFLSYLACLLASSPHHGDVDSAKFACLHVRLTYVDASFLICLLVKDSNMALLADSESRSYAAGNSFNRARALLRRLPVKGVVDRLLHCSHIECRDISKNIYFI